MAMKFWRMPKAQPQLAEVLAEDCGLSPFVTEILVNRGIANHADVLSFFEHELALEDPFLLCDMDKAVALLQQSMEADEKIVIYGDYDCDGITSTVMLYSYLAMLGANISYYIPDRIVEGYGMNEAAVRRIAENGANLILTVDNGVAAVEEIKIAKEYGLKVLVTDHHQPGNVLPPADAVVNPHRKDCQSTFKKLAGVGVAFKLIVAMENGDYESVFEQFGDLLTLGTVGDLVPLIGENRWIVQQGLQQLSGSENLGIAALCEVCGIDLSNLSAQNLAFGLIPRINAAGRMAHAELAVRLLLADDYGDALTLAEELNQLNEQRKAEEDRILTDIESGIAADPSLLYDRVLTFYHEGWSHGVIGIVSSRIMERYGKPNLLMALEDGVLTGSGRSVEFFPLYRALDHCRKHLIRYGGHTQAAGFALKQEDFSGFKAVLEEFAASNFWVMPSYDYVVDKVIRPEELSLENVHALELLEPFGSENQQPLFLFENVKLLGLTPVSDHKHLRLKLKFGSTEMTAMYFRMSPDRFPYHVGTQLDFLANVQINHYQNKEYLSVVIRDVHQHGFDQRSYFNAKAYYEMLRREEPVKSAVVGKMIPTREDLGVLYRSLKQTGGYEGDLDLLFPVFLSRRVNYAKFRLMLDILEEAGLIQIAPALDHINLCAFEGKADLEQTRTMKLLRRLAAQS